ncbi:unnamed protein product [Calypogeia fissa]
MQLRLRSKAQAVEDERVARSLTFEFGLSNGATELWTTGLDNYPNYRSSGSSYVQEHEDHFLKLTAVWLPSTTQKWVESKDGTLDGPVSNVQRWKALTSFQAVQTHQKFQICHAKPTKIYTWG